MSVLIEDSPRNLVKWVNNAVDGGLARGHVLSPWASPWVKLAGRKRHAPESADLVRQGGGEIWFDPLTHALQMNGVGDFRYYDEYSLWSGTRGDLSTDGLRGDHLRRVFDVQDQLGAPHLAPTVLLHHAQSNTSQLALDLAREAMAQDPGAWLTIAGTSPFWSGGAELDAHIGALAQLAPAGWFLSVVRPSWELPVAAIADEVHGLCRTVRALSEYAQVHISHGDVAGLPAVASGAASVGTGWDQRQRVCSMAAFAARDPDAGGGGGWYERPTLEGLIGSLKRAEALVLQQQNAGLAAQLGTVPPPGPEEAFQSHLAALGVLMSSVASAGPSTPWDVRFVNLRAMYLDAESQWPLVEALTGCDLGAPVWVKTFLQGLEMYGRTEGWLPVV